MLPELPTLPRVEVSYDLGSRPRASWGFSTRRFFDPTAHVALIGHPRLRPDAIIAIGRSSVPDDQNQPAEPPRNPGRFNSRITRQHRI